MRRYFILCLLFSLPVFADQFVPEFDKMQYVRCDVEETIYNQDGSIVSKNNYHRFLRFEDEFSRLYLQKELISNVISYDKDKVEYKEQSMTDDFIMYSNIVINRINNEYISKSRIIYDNPDFSPRYSQAKGNCKILKN